jgi:hypothetical protein
MAISFRKYVDITSGVGGNAAVRRRDLIGRLFTTNPLVPVQSFVEFDSASDVGSYFGTTSEEYRRALFYFSWISKNITRAKKIQFARFVDAAAAPRIYGSKGLQALGSWTSITAGAFGLTIGGVSNTMSALDFSGAASLTAVAAIIQAAIRTKVGTQWTNALVTWDPVRQSFNLVTGTTGPATITVQPGAGASDITGQLGWNKIDTIISDGGAVETPVDSLTASAEASDNFGSYLFLKALSDAEELAIAQWNNDQNFKFQYMIRTDATDAATDFETLVPYAGVALTLADLTEEFDEMVPMIILAATDYSKRNSTQNYMFQVFPLTPKVSKTIDSNTYDDLRVNYYGRTQTAGQFLDFYQRGVLMGQGQAATDQNVYGNEQWLKDAAGASIMELLLSLAKVSANDTGRIQLSTTVQSVIDEALYNGVISVGKKLNNTQKIYIAELTGDDLAYIQVENIGYWLDVTMQSYVTEDGRTEWKAIYTLIYSKDDVVRKVEGTHVLI